MARNEKCRVSQSRAKSWRQCKQQHQYKYVEKLTRRRVRRPFRFGRIVHDMLETYANKGDPFKKLDEIAVVDRKVFAAEKEFYGEIIDDIGTIMTEYFEYYPKNSLRYLPRAGQYSEHKFEIDLNDQVVFTGKIDSAVKTPNRLKWLLEHKSFSKEVNDDERWRSVQSGVYYRANQILDWFKDIEGMCWDYIKSKAPTRPQLLKSGALSSKQIITLPSTVRATIKDHGLSESDYRVLIGNAERHRATYFYRVFTPYQDKIIDSIWDDFVITANEIADIGDKRHERNIGRHCGWCDYEGLCRAAMTGGDEDYVKEKEYIVDEKEKSSDTRKTSATKRRTRGTSRKIVARRRCRRS